MKRIRVIPVLLLLNNGLVKTVRFSKPNYIGDPINAVKIFNEKEVDEIVLLDISKDQKQPNFTRVREICSEAFMPFAYGGSIHSMDHIKQLFDCGIEKIILNSAAYQTPEIIEKASAVYGNQSILVAMDVKKTLLGGKQVHIKNGQVNTHLKPLEYAQRAINAGAGEIILTSVDYEGTTKGFDLELIRNVSSNIAVPLVAHGGAGNINDFTDAIRAGASAVAAGSMFVYHGQKQGILINYPSQAKLMNEVYSKF
jgi:cyclase